MQNGFHVHNDAGHYLMSLHISDRAEASKFASKRLSQPFVLTRMSDEDAQRIDRALARAA